MEFKQYPSYKNSGVEWLGDVPEHWNTKPTKYCFKLITDKAIENNSEVLLSVYTDIGVKPRSELEERGNKASTTDGYWIVKKGDIIVNKLLAWMGAIGLSNYSGVTSPAYDILRIKYNYTPEYYNYLFRNGDMFTEFKRYSRGLMDMRLRLYFSEFGNIKLPVPSIDEQQKIVSFLDTETARIDTLIAKQEKLIELLEEQRKSIISHAVTKGLNPNALMKDSGVEWLGRVPCDWQYYSIKRTIKVLTDYTANGSFADLAKNVNYLDYGFSRLVRLTDLREDLNNNGVYITEDAHKYLKKSELFGGELLLANVGAYAGFACLMPNKKIKATLAPNMFLLRFKEQRINNKFMYYLINSKTIQYQFQVSMTSTAQPKLNKDNVKSIVMFLPTLQIQNEIVEYLDSENLILDNLIFKQQALIEKLKEYRASIISHAVTGKIDVREHMA